MADPEDGFRKNNNGKITMREKSKTAEKLAAKNRIERTVDMKKNSATTFYDELGMNEVCYHCSCAVENRHSDICI